MRKVTVLTPIIVKRPIEIVGDIAIVRLTKGYACIIDVADVHLAEGRNWNATPTHGGAFYATAGTRKDEGLKPTIFLHRIIFGDDTAPIVDHEDNDSLNNRRSNLRRATVNQNRWNSKVPVTNTSGVKGVTWSKKMSQWKAQIHFHKKNVHLGFFDTLEEAGAAYVRASQFYHGDFARSE